MRQQHAVFGHVEEVVEELLVPDWGVGWGKAAHADCEEVHVQHGDLGPGIEGRD